jgi:hypothetical protein
MLLAGSYGSLLSRTGEKRVSHKKMSYCRLLVWEKKQSSKFQVQFLLNVYCFYTIVKVKILNGVTIIWWSSVSYPQSSGKCDTGKEIDDVCVPLKS